MTQAHNYQPGLLHSNTTYRNGFRTGRPEWVCGRCSSRWMANHIHNSSHESWRTVSTTTTMTNRISTQKMAIIFLFSPPPPPPSPNTHTYAHTINHTHEIQTHVHITQKETQQFWETFNMELHKTAICWMSTGAPLVWVLAHEGAISCASIRSLSVLVVLVPDWLVALWMKGAAIVPLRDCRIGFLAHDALFKIDLVIGPVHAFWTLWLFSAVARNLAASWYTTTCLRVRRHGENNEWKWESLSEAGWEHKYHFSHKNIWWSNNTCITASCFVFETWCLPMKPCVCMCVRMCVCVCVFWQRVYTQKHTNWMKFHRVKPCGTAN
jgi:hypothetical protein